MTPQPALKLRPYQEAGIESVEDALRSVQAVCLTSPTGSGKTAWASEFIARRAKAGQRALILTKRRILLAQTDAALTRHGVEHGVFAAGYPESVEDITLGSIQTLSARDARPDCDLVLIDEAHSATGRTARALIGHYRRAGAKIVGMSATPTGLAGLYDALVSMSSNSELIAAGVLVKGVVYGLPEPNMAGVRITKSGEFVQGEMVRRLMTCSIYGDVIRHFFRLNADQRPTALFALDVQASRYFVREFVEHGVPAAHIDGDTTQAERDAIFDQLADGTIKLVSSCGVLREGWDCPCVEFGVLAQPTHKLSTYIQLCGRLRRAFPGKTHFTLADHSGCWWRFGSADMDRSWSLDDDDSTLARKRREACESGAIQQDVCCPECGRIRQGGTTTCPLCGFKHLASVRVVRCVDGSPFAFGRLVGHR